MTENETDTAKELRPRSQPDIYESTLPEGSGCEYCDSAADGDIRIQTGQTVKSTITYCDDHEDRARTDIEDRHKDIINGDIQYKIHGSDAGRKRVAEVVEMNELEAEDVVAIHVEAGEGLTITVYQTYGSFTGARGTVNPDDPVDLIAVDDISDDEREGGYRDEWRTEADIKLTFEHYGHYDVIY
jgi:hypothetical protein